MMRYRSSSSEPQNNNETSTTGSHLTPSRKRRNEESSTAANTTAQMFPTHMSSKSHEQENDENSILDTQVSTSNQIHENSNTLGTPTTTKVQLKVRIKRFHAVAHWTWGSNTHDDVCSICQNPFEGVCPGVKYPGEDCPVVWGKCLHAFHLQCINTWLTSSAAAAAAAATTPNTTNPKLSCPICRQEWEFRSSQPETTSAGTTTTNATATTT